MKYLTYKNTKNHEDIFVENVALSDIAKAVGTPFYCYSKRNLVENFGNFVSAFEEAKLANYKICYAIKANYNIHLVKILAGLGAGIDAVSAGEIYRGIKAGIEAKKIVFAGVGKTKAEMEYALKAGVEEFSVESEAEMFLLNKTAISLNKKAKFSLRVNPNVDAKTHDKISTGRKGDKFGVDIERAVELYSVASQMQGLEVYGISMHIGSQITSIEPFKVAFAKMRELCLELRAQGLTISSLDFGGGIGITYNDEPTLPLQEYANLIKEITHDLNVKIVIAPGRALVGTCGLLVASVVFLKETAVKNFVIIDAAMNDLMRPGLYGSYHGLLPVIKKSGEEKMFDLAGPVCESTDILAHNRKIVDPKSGDLLVLTAAGAYGSSMSNEYNCRPMIPEILIEENKFRIIRRRPNFDEMMFLEE